MTAWIVLMATATLGVDQGWQPIAGGGYEYIIQIEPETLESIKSGRDLFFHLPPSLGGVRGYRITSGKEPLPHNGEPLPESVTKASESELRNGPSLGGDPRAVPPSDGQTAKTTTLDEKPAPGTMTPDPGSRPLSPPATSNPQATGNEQASGASASPVAASAALPNSAASAAPNETIQDGRSPSDEQPPGFDAAGHVAALPNWMSLNAALMVLFASAGVNLFLGWVTVAQRGRYRSVLARLAVR